MDNIKRIISKCMIIFMVTILSVTVVVGHSSVEVFAASKKPGKVTISSVKSYDYNAIKVSWEKASNAEKYQVYRSTSKDGTYKLVKTTKSVSYINEGLTTGKTYYYKVRAVNDDKKGSFSAKKSAKPTLKKVTKISVKETSSTGLKVTWSKVNGAKGYKVYRATSKDGTYKLLKTTTLRNYKDTGLTLGKTYYYKVRAYKVVNEKNKYGTYSNVESCKVGSLNSIRKYMISMINEERAKENLDELELLDSVNETAQIKAKDLYNTGVFDHYSENLGYVNDQFDEEGIPWISCGENIAYGYTSVNSVMDGWMNSPGHKANILDDYTHVGIGYYRGYWVQQFITCPENDDIFAE